MTRHNVFDEYMNMGADPRSWEAFASEVDWWPHPDKKLRPVFSGITLTGEKIVLYRFGKEFHLMIPSGEVWALGPSSWWEHQENLGSTDCKLQVKSEMWSGTAFGNRQRLRDEPAR